MTQREFEEALVLSPSKDEGPHGFDALTMRA